MTTTTVTRYVEFDTGHRVARHESACSNFHGHRYRLTVEVEGPVRDDNSAQHGMVIDFGHIKDALQYVHDLWDHRFLIGADDPLADVFNTAPGVIVVDRQPTAENLAAIAAGHLSRLLAPLTVTRVTMQETTKCEATWRP